MKHRERVKTVLDGGVPDFVPTFELVFDETERDFEGRVWVGGPVEPPDVASMSYMDKIKHNARLYLDVARKYEHSLIFVNRSLGIHENQDNSGVPDTIKEIRNISGDEYMIMAHNDPTFMIPMGNMEDFCYDLIDRPEHMHEVAAKSVEDSKDLCHKLMTAGADGFIMCCDYCFNDGPFMSPNQFSEFVTPYLVESVAHFREQGAYVIKHTDGNIMPIVDDLVSARPHALHSLDPMAGVDIKLVKEKYGHEIALCGNVHCAHMQTGTTKQIRDSAEYCMEHGKPDGGYIFCTSNCVFRGMPLESYDLIHSIWMKSRDY
jgi:uroporphyrinogen decarboxylase